MKIKEKEMLMPDNPQELLKALEEMVYWFGRYPEIVPNPDALESYKTTVKNAKQAIAKAKGEV